MKKYLLCFLLCNLQLSAFALSTEGGPQNLENVTGTLPVENGGTEATSFTNGSLLLGNGTSPIVALSTLTNTGTGLGVGTASPQTILDVNGASQFGSEATKSTMSATGALTLANGASLTVNGASITATGFNLTGAGTVLGGLTIASVTATGDINTAGVVVGGNGGASAPTFSFSSDPDTGMLRGAANQLNWATGGTSRMRLTSTGLSINTGAAPTSVLDVAGSSITATALHITNASTFVGHLQASSSMTIVNAVEISSAISMTGNIISNSGYIKTSSQPVACLMLSANTPANSGVDQDIYWATDKVQGLTMFNSASSNTITVPVTGFYNTCGQIYVDTVVDGGLMHSRIIYSSTAKIPQFAQLGAGANSQAVSFCHTQYLTANDTIKIRLLQSTGSLYTISGGASGGQTFACVMLLP